MYPLYGSTSSPATETNSQLMSSSNSKASPSLIESFTHYLEILNLTHSKFNIFAWILKPILSLITFYQGVRANMGAFLYRKRLVHGENFVCAGGVWMGEFDEIKRNLTEPQARAYKLASSQLDKNHLPMWNLGGDTMTFLLSLSQRGAGGDGTWEAVRSAIENYVTHTEETALRMKDDTARQLIDELVEEYKRTGMKTDGEFFDNHDRGLQDFLLKYLHYVLLGLDPNDAETMGTLNKLHYESISAAYYLATVGNSLQCLKFRSWPAQIRAVAKIYADSPALANFADHQEKYKGITRFELAATMVSMMSLAGMVGPETLAVIVLGNRPLNPYQGQKTGDIDVTKIWDQINLEDHGEVKRYIYECGRLRNPVSNSHRVATEDFVANIGGKSITFPKGTIIYIPMLLAGLDEKVWGETTFEFDHNRKNLCPFSTIFHSFGEETNGRICPGKAVAEHMMIDVLVALGKCRRSEGVKVQ